MNKLIIFCLFTTSSIEKYNERKNDSVTNRKSKK